jgi:hypothetical protein
MADIIQYAKFYTNLSNLEKELNDTANLAIHLKADALLAEKLIEAADAIKEHIKNQSESKVFKDQ